MNLVLILTASIVCFSDDYIIQNGYVVTDETKCVKMDSSEMKKQCLNVFESSPEEDEENE